MGEAPRSNKHDEATREPGPAPALLSVRGLGVHFASRGRTIRAVDGVSFDLDRGRTLGIVGESGSGKTTVGRAVLRLIPASAGRITFDGRDLVWPTDGASRAGRAAPQVRGLSPRAMRPLRRRMQIIFQDPGGSLNPRMRVGAIVAEPLFVHRVVRGRDELRARAGDLLERCGLERSAADRWPHEFSGGQKQRIAIARALALEPDFVVCDEPTSALDVSVQAQILNLLKDLQRDMGLSYLFISHDMAVVDHMCDRIAVMSEGRIVESGTREEVLGSPKEVYTRQLLAAVPGRK